MNSMVLASMTIKTLQNLNFKIFHQIGSWHTNVDVLNHNFVDAAEIDENLGDEIQYCKIL